ncbi:uncharacterized protein DNG_01493 [Cephalotrichum gorgonifer]|uniref:Protein CAP22 n=1 Tax=Cephalotrichum gorgonifer TaxID=2041049 RepID=A0AAE8SRP7_9PEZI|nr:uncharacterized protein DNG_01493 [Cephalotrichum gorgonifer]
MHLSKTLPVASALLLSALPLAAADFDREDIPTACTTICEPVRQLVRLCDVDDDAVGGDRNEDLLERQCICQNTSFDVANVAGQCQDCVEKNWRNGCRDDDDSDDDDDDNACDDGREDINKIVRVCGFSSVSYDSAATSQVQTISVAASKATDVAQLTTTVNPQETGSIGMDSPNGGNNNNNDNSNNNNQGSDDGSGAAQGALPGMVVCVSGAIIAGIMMLQ